jgi:zinc transporter
MTDADRADAQPPRPSPVAAALAAEIIPGLVWGFHIGEDSIARPIREAADLHSPLGGWFWLHFNLADMRARNWLAAAALLPRAGTELLLSPDDMQQLVTADTCFRGVVFDLARDIDRVHEEFGFFRFVLAGPYLVTGRRKALNAAEAVRRAVEDGARFTSPAELLAAIVERVADGIDQIVEALSVEIDAIEDGILRESLGDERQRLGRVRLTTVRIHRRLNGLRILFRRLAADGSDGPVAAIRAFVGRLAQRLDEIDHDVVELRDRAHLLQEEVTLKLAEQTNRHLHVLSVLTAVLLPPSLVAGLFGMNVGGLPLTESGHGFLGALLLTAGSSLLAVLLLRFTGVLGRGRQDPPADEPPSRRS